MKQHYRSTSFRQPSLELISLINSIVGEYQAAGFTLTVRQLYYQLVARGHIPNTERSYKNTTALVNDARLAGMIDWDAIEDRTREFITRPRWASGNEILDGVARQFHMDMWANQQTRVFVIVEKEALTGVLQATCHKNDVPLLAARGYPSASVLREFADTTLLDAVREGQNVAIIHLGDHDPSGIDMTRDLEDRIRMFLDGEGSFELRRIALTMDQIEEQQPPPNPAKITDSRYASYRAEYGGESWELDALRPQYLNALVESTIDEYIDTVAWNETAEEIKTIRGKLAKIAKEFK